MNKQRRYPIEQSDIDEAIERERSGVKQKIPERVKVKINSSPQKRIRRRAKNSNLPIVSLADAIKRLGDDEIYRKAGKGFRWDKDD